MQAASTYDTLEITERGDFEAVAASWIAYCRRVRIFGIAMFLSAVYAYGVVQRLPPGRMRIIVLLPVIFVIYAAPLLFDHVMEPCTLMAASFMSFRMTAGKVLALAMGRGALSRPLTFWQFCVLLLMPIMPQDPQPAPAQPSPEAGDQHRSGAAALRQAPDVDDNTYGGDGGGLGGRRGSGTSVSSAASSTAMNNAAAGAVFAAIEDGVDAPLKLQGACQARPGPSAPAEPYAGSRTSVAADAIVLGAFLAYTLRSRAAALTACTSIAGVVVMWQGMHALMAACAAPAQRLFGLALLPHFVAPLAATSLSDFWARRWNLTQSMVLRHYVYEPLLEGQLLPAGAAAGAPLPQPRQPRPGGGGGQQQQQPQQQWEAGASDAAAQRTAASAARRLRLRRQLATAATFVVSGVEHELYHYYVVRAWGWRWFAFFALQGPLLAAERRLKGAARRCGLRLSRPVQSVAVLLVLGLASDLWFWPVVLQPVLVGRLAAAGAATAQAARVVAALVASRAAAAAGPPASWTQGAPLLLQLGGGGGSGGSWPSLPAAVNSTVALVGQLVGSCKGRGSMP